MGTIAKKQAGERIGKIVGLLFFAFFAIFGIFILNKMGIRPIRKVVNARDWVEVSCEIISANVNMEDDSDSVTYRIDIVYEYEFDGKTYKSDRYDFMGGSSSGCKNKAKIVKRYKKARDPICFVNPNNPSEAVLHKGLHRGFLWGLFPLPFVAIGIGGGIWIVKNRSKSDLLTEEGWKPKLKRSSVDCVGAGFEAANEPLVIKTKSPWARLVFSIAVAAFWNGIISFFLFDVIDGWRSGEGDIFQTLFFIPFVLIGLGMIGLVGYSFMLLFNPRPTLILSSGAIQLGGVVQLKWNFSGRTKRIRNLRISLKGVEASRYEEGSSTHTDENTFFEMEIYSTQNQYEILAGEVGLAIPIDLMHSFEGKNNKIIWEIELHGSVDLWPDVRECFTLNVMPVGLVRK